MTELNGFKIGQRVQYAKGNRIAIGHIVRFWPADIGYDENDEKYVIEPAASVRLTYRPDWWGYDDLVFAPDLSELEAA